MEAPQIINDDSQSLNDKVQALLDQMTLEEKIGQMCQVNGDHDHVPDWFADQIRGGRIGSILNQVNVDLVNEMQRLAVEESRLGIPILVGRDVIHGFKTVFPIPLGQAASWNPELVQQGARVAAIEAASHGVQWTFAPMIDVTRDPRWGRIAESIGEDPYLTGVMGAAMVKGFQSDDLGGRDAIAACAKHFAGYGASESGRDYNTTNIPENELRNVYLRPFKAAADAGVTTFMTSFGDLNGIPASGNRLLLKDVLRDEWQFQGFVVSDWDSIRQLSIHGFTENDKESAYKAASIGLDMEMASDTYAHHLAALVEEGRIPTEQVDWMVANILRAKFRLGLFDNPYTKPEDFPEMLNDQFLGHAKQAAAESLVLLKNDHQVLPLDPNALSKVAVIGPMADAPYEQLGTWVFDGDAEASVSALKGLQSLLPEQVEVLYARGTETTRSHNTDGFAEAIAAAEQADSVVLFLGEESILSGEAHCRADIGLPGNQAQLLKQIRQVGKPVTLVVLAGRPLTLADVVDDVDAILYGWHPGTMGGPAIAEVLLGHINPSGKLPVTFPKMVGQIPIYYAHKHTGKPPSRETIVHIDDIDPFAPQTSLGMTSFHLDAGFEPLFPFGFGLSYTHFEYHNMTLSSHELPMGDSVVVSADIVNTGDRAGVEVVQLYIRDLVGDVTRPVRELKGFRRVHLNPGESRRVEFELHTDDLAFYDQSMKLITEPGEFHVWIAGDAVTGLHSHFRVLAPD